MTQPTGSLPGVMQADATRLARTARRQRVLIVVLGGLLTVLAGVGFGRATGAAQIEQYTAGGDRLYRIWDDGRVEYLEVDLANGSVEGIPGWAPVHIDHKLSRDRMGNEIVLPRR